MKESFSKRVISQRFGSCEELADAIVFMAGSKASYIWGATLVVDGGTLPFAFY
jgi:NAD(P)-dependent dehydrogenase (short-subunit alcohol dehydrogenase family)